MEKLHSEVGPHPGFPRPVILWRGERYYGMTHGEIVADLEEAHPELLVEGSFSDEVYQHELRKGFEFSPDEEIVEDREVALERVLEAGLLDHLSPEQIEAARKSGLQSVHLQKYLH